jgi:hypothetical protein
VLESIIRGKDDERRIIIRIKLYLIEKLEKYKNKE